MLPASRAVAPPGSRIVVSIAPRGAATVTLPDRIETALPSTFTDPAPTSDTIAPLSVMICVVPPDVRTS